VSIVPVAQVAPTKPKRKVGIPTRTSPAKEPSKDPDVIFKPSLDLAQAMEDYFDKDDNYLLVVYNDNLNKRAYVAAALAEVLGFNSDMSEAVMMQAHMYGYAVAGEWYKELCEEYAKKLTDKGIIAKATKASGDGDGGDAGAGG
jgi:ATP-dependent Clp protease adapter protein ClpS